MIEPPVPRIVPRSEHSLSRQNIDPEALKVLYRLWDHGFVSYLVGGCVRDLLLGKIPKDFDVATDAHPQQIKEVFRNSRLIGRRFRIAHVFFRGGKYIEVSTFRRKSEFEEEAEIPHPQGENTFGTPAEDALRRDITINGIFYNPRDFSLIDYVGGLEDLQNGIIRCIGDPDEKFHQDPVRMIRVVRHAARTRFRIEEETYQALLRHVAELDLCSRSRVRDEFLRDLCEGSAEASIRLMLKTGMLRALFPLSQPPGGRCRSRRVLFQHPEGDRCAVRVGKSFHPGIQFGGFSPAFSLCQRSLGGSPPRTPGIGPLSGKGPGVDRGGLRTPPVYPSRQRNCHRPPLGSEGFPGVSPEPAASLAFHEQIFFPGSQAALRNRVPGFGRRPRLDRLAARRKDFGKKKEKKTLA